ncbi:MAG: hypothetical protein RL173_3687 [Fibrobacterota bacterium]|jgi:hypothetical protein
MWMPDELARRALAYFGRILGKEIPSREALAALPASELLLLADKLPDGFLPAMVGLLKGVGPHGFEKLLGDHEEENRELSERFFERYRAMVLEPDHSEDDNPLEIWLPREACHDLAFLSTRQAFFLRQEIRHINEWLERHFQLGPFPPAGQEEAWSALWAHLTSA